MKRILSALGLCLCLGACDSSSSTVAPSHVRWSFKQSAQDESGMPHTALELVDAQTDRVLYREVCDGVIPPPLSPPDASRHAAVISCEWNGQTVAYGVRESGDGWVVERQTDGRNWEWVEAVQ